MHDDDETREERRAREERERWDAKSHAVCAKLFDADRPTTNGHVYPKRVLEKMAAEIRERIAKGEVLGGFLDPAVDTDYTRLRDMSHKVTDVGVEDNALVARIEVLPTPQARSFRNSSSVARSSSPARPRAPSTRTAWSVTMSSCTRSARASAPTRTT
jgi:hypothetical protein